MSLRTLKYQRTTNTPKTYRRSVSYSDLKPCSEFIFILFIIFNTIFRWFTLVWCSFIWTKLCKWGPTKCRVSRKSKWVENLELIAWMNLPRQIIYRFFLSKSSVKKKKENTWVLTTHLEFEFTKLAYLKSNNLLNISKVVLICHKFCHVTFGCFHPPVYSAVLVVAVCIYPKGAIYHLLFIFIEKFSYTQYLTED